MKLNAGSCESLGNTMHVLLLFIYLFSEYLSLWSDEVILELLYQHSARFFY